jgi:hypothetical protein
MHIEIIHEQKIHGNTAFEAKSIKDLWQNKHAGNQDQIIQGPDAQNSANIKSTDVYFSFGFFLFDEQEGD